MKRVLIWDLPTRVFHWSLVTSFAGAWLTSQSDRWLATHAFFGYLMLGLIGFRLAWGLVGGHYARFASFAYGPMAGLAYLREMASGRAARHVGHNPAGSQGIYLLLALGLVVTVSGLFTLGGEEQQSGYGISVSLATGMLLRKVHEFAGIAMLVVAAGHLAGVLVESLLHKENLARSMITGIKEAPDNAPASETHLPIALVLVPVVAALATWWFLFATHAENAAVPHLTFASQNLPDDPLWREECGSCHVAFHPSLLPARSWRAVLANQKDHFGSDLALDAGTVKSLLVFHEANAAEKSAREAAFKINRSVPADRAPLRITQTDYWVAKHRQIPQSIWDLPAVKSKANCQACHLDAKEGTYEDAAVRMPAKPSPR